MSEAMRFRVQMKARFTRKPDGTLRSELGITERQARFFDVAGGAIRKTARRSLKRAAQKKISDLTPEERESFQRRMAWYNAVIRQGGSAQKPRRPDKISQPGKVPLLHMQPSPLKERLFYAVSDDKTYVVVGPELYKKTFRKAAGGLASIEQLEQSRPFMRPAFNNIEPRIPSYLERAFR
jgi:hypothetical protein